MSERTRRWAVGGTRALAGAAVAVATVVIAAVAVSAPWPVVAQEPLSVSALPTAAESIVACDGAVLSLGRDARADEVTVARAQRPLVAVADIAQVRAIPLAGPDVVGEPDAPAYGAVPGADGVAGLAAASSARLQDEDLAGFAADGCRPSLFESWLVGGDTTTGTADLVVVSNPGDVTAIVDITVYGAGEPTIPPGGSDVLVPAQTQRVIPLSGIAGGEESPVLRLTATGAPVRASLQSSLTRTLVPGGIDQQSAVQATSLRPVVPGLVVTSPSTPAATEVPTIARILSPEADGEATVTVTAVGASTPAIEPSTVPLGAGIPTELELSGLPAGTYTVWIESSVPAVAAVWQTTGFGAGADFAWFTSAPVLSAPTLVAAPTGPSPRLQLANGGTEATTVTLRGLSGGAEQTVEVAAGGSASLALSGGTVWMLDPGSSDAVHAQITYAGPGALAGFAVWQGDAAAAPVAVYP